MAPSIEEISAAFARCHLTLSDDEQRLAVAVYRLLATGHPASPAAIADLAGWSLGDVEVRLTAWRATVRNDAGEVTGFGGLATEAVTRHRMDIDGAGTVWTWCAYDTLFIPHLLGVSAQVDSVCPTSGEPVRLTASLRGVANLRPGEAVVSLRLVDKPLGEGVRQMFCDFILFFTTPAAAETWTDAHPGTFWIPVSDAFEVARRTNRAVYPAVVDADPAR